MRAGMMEQRKGCYPSWDREGAILFPVSGGLFIKGTGIEVLLLEPLEAPCQVETLCSAKNKRRSHGW